MAYNTIMLALHDDQLAVLDAATPQDNADFALLAQPYTKGSKRGDLRVYILTPEQFRTVQPAIMHARELPEYVKP